MVDRFAKGSRQCEGVRLSRLHACGMPGRCEKRGNYTRDGRWVCWNHKIATRIRWYDTAHLEAVPEAAQQETVGANEFERMAGLTPTQRKRAQQLGILQRGQRLPALIGHRWPLKYVLETRTKIKAAGGASAWLKEAP